MAGTGLLQGQRLLVTRPEDEQSDAAIAIRAMGGVPVPCPTIQIEPPSDWRALDAAIERIDRFDWLIFTSANAVRSFARRLNHISSRNHREKWPRIAALGPGVETALIEWNLPISFIPTQANAQEFAIQFLAVYDIRDARVFMPLSDIARRVLPDALQKAGANVVEAIAYRNVAVKNLPAEVESMLMHGEIDWALFFSPSTARNFFDLAPAEKIGSSRFRIASIGPTTSESLRALGRPPEVEAHPHTLEGLLKAISGG